MDFSVGGVVPPPGDGISILADFEYRTAEGRLCGAFVFERAGMLAGLEVWSVDGLCTPSTLPAIQPLQPLGSVQQTEPGLYIRRWHVGFSRIIAPAVPAAAELGRSAKSRKRSHRGLSLERLGRPFSPVR